MSSVTSSEFETSLIECIKALKTAKKRKINPSSYSFYAEKVRSKLALLRKSFLKLQRNYPSERFPKAAFQLAAVEPLVQKAVTLYPTSLKQMIALLIEIKFKYDSELSAEIEIAESKIEFKNEPPYLPDDLIQDRYQVLKKILWEINQCYTNACYNSCAAMIRRLVENLIIDAYEHHNLHSVIIDNQGNYFAFKKLIGKVSNQPEFKLTRETKRILPELKFFGDIGSHNRMALVRKPDLDRFHAATRVAVEELSRNI